METIFAPATPPGRSGVAVLRISGKEAGQVFDLFALPHPLPRMATLACLKDPMSGEMIDQALLFWFPAPSSFTGEDVVELHLHGSRAVMGEMLRLLSKQEGFRLAEPGEFSRRAFMNNKMDLTAAEGIADLIDAETQAQRKQALRQMSGTLAQACEALRTHIIEVRAHLEAYLDFPDEEIPREVATRLDDEVLGIETLITRMLGDNRIGEKIREGFYVVLLGIPNAGKSTLMNLLAKRDVVIVSPEAGTTRDIIEVHLEIGGALVTLADMAGIRQTTATIEAEGITRALIRAVQADLRLLVLDVSAPRSEQAAILSHEQPDDVVILHKSDLTTPHMGEYLELADALPVSSQTGEGVENLISVLKQRIDERLSGGQDAVITRERHRVAFERAREHLAASRRATALEIKGEELRLASYALSTVIGVVQVEDILDVVFSSFCIGK